MKHTATYNELRWADSGYSGSVYVVKCTTMDAITTICSACHGTILHKQTNRTKC